MKPPLQPPAGPVDPDWHETFFTGLMNEFWLAAADEALTEAETAFLWDALALKPGARTLDLGCGAGRVSLALAARGCVATGVDLSDDFLNRARAATPEGASVTWEKQNLAAPEFPPGQFDAAFMLGNALGYMRPEDTQAMLTATGAALKPGGRLALNTAGAAECLLPHFEEMGDDTAGDVRLRIAHRYDPLEGALLTTFEASKGRRTETREGLQYIHTIREIAAMLDQAGLSVTGLFADTDGAAWEMGDPELYIIAERR